MRIISKFKDYYDGVQGMDLEKDDVFVRTKKCMQIDNPRHASSYTYFCPTLFDVFKIARTGKRDLVIRNGVIGFCGEIIPFIRIDDDNHIDYSFDLTDYDIYNMHSFKYEQSKHRLISFLRRTNDYDYSSFISYFQKYDVPYFSIFKYNQSLNDYSKLRKLPDDYDFPTLNRIFMLNEMLTQHIKIYQCMYLVYLVTEMIKLLQYQTMI